METSHPLLLVLFGLGLFCAFLASNRMAGGYRSWLPIPGVTPCWQV